MLYILLIIQMEPELNRVPSVSSSLGDDDISVLPETFDVNNVKWIESPKCMICGAVFGKLISGKHHWYTLTEADTVGKRYARIAHMREGNYRFRTAKNIESAMYAMRI